MPDPASLFRLDGKVAIVTGAGGGIGEKIAELFAAAGAAVVLADRDGDRTAEAVGRIADIVPSARMTRISYDQSDIASIDAMVTAAEAALGPVDILVNNAAAFGFASIEDLTADEWDRLQAVNLRGVAFCCQAAIRRMVPRGGGRIVNISSIAAQRFVLEANTAYATTKAGVIALTRNLAREYAGRGLRINCVVPGAIEITTPPREALAQPLVGPMMQPGFIPSGGAGQPQDVAAACLYLASEAGRYVVGQSLAVDGGISAG